MAVVCCQSEAAVLKHSSLEVVLCIYMVEKNNWKKKRSLSQKSLMNRETFDTVKLRKQCFEFKMFI